MERKVALYGCRIRRVVVLLQQFQPGDTVVRQGDTDLIPAGGGHGSSRATYMGGTAIWRASDGIIAKGMALAADALEAAEADVLLHVS